MWGVIAIHSHKQQYQYQDSCEAAVLVWECFIVIYHAVCLSTGPQPLPNQSSTDCDLVLPVSNYCSCLQLLPLLSITSILLLFFLQLLVLLGSFYTRCDQSSYPSSILFYVRYSSPTFCIISFLTRSVQMIFSVPIQNHNSKLFQHFWSTFRSVQFSGPHRCMFHVQNFRIYVFHIITTCFNLKWWIFWPIIQNS